MKWRAGCKGSGCLLIAGGLMRRYCYCSNDPMKVQYGLLFSQKSTFNVQINFERRLSYYRRRIGSEVRSPQRLVQKLLLLLLLLLVLSIQISPVLLSIYPIYRVATLLHAFSLPVVALIPSVRIPKCSCCGIQVPPAKVA